MRPIEVDHDVFFIEAVTDFYYRFVEPRYSALISNSLSQAAGTQITARLLPPDQATEYRKGKDAPKKVP